MQTEPIPAISRLVDHHGGPVALSRKLDGSPVYQEIQRWVARGWAAPAHIFKLEPLLPEGITLHDLNNDRTLAKVRQAAARQAEEVSP